MVRSPSLRCRAGAGQGRAGLRRRELPLIRDMPGSVGYLLVAALLAGCSCAQMMSPSSRPAGVVPFEEVWSRSYCRSRETLVDVLREYPQEAEHIFKPPCVPLWRCAGCCGDESLECIALETRTVELQVVRVSPILGTSRQEAMKFTEHTRCICRPRRKRLKSERSHRIGAKRRPREPSPPPSTTLGSCERPGGGTLDAEERDQEEALGWAEPRIQPLPRRPFSP